MDCQNCEYAFSKEGGCNEKDFEGNYRCVKEVLTSKDSRLSHTEYSQRLSRIRKATGLLILVVDLIWGTPCFAQDIDFEKLANAIKKAENSYNHPYGILKDYCKAGDPNGQCRKGCLQTIIKRYKMWDKKGDFIEYLSRSYCPIGAENDPKGLNKNWIKNVKWFYEK